MADDHGLLERFVAAFGAWEDLIGYGVDVPREIAVASKMEGHATHWRPLRVTHDTAALAELEAHLPARLPPLYAALVLGWRFMRVELDEYALLANPPGPGLEGLRAEIFRDPVLSSVTLANGYIPFGQGTDGRGYDPVCFNLRARRQDGDMEVVRLDHKEILCYDGIRVVKVLARSFRELVARNVESAERRRGGNA
jgi:hypothetical protein